MIRKHLIKTAASLSMALLLAACSDLFMDEQQMLQQARQYLEVGDINAAAIELRNTLEENAQNAEARYLLARIYLDAGDFPTAEKEFRRALAAGWDASEVTLGVMRAKLEMGDFKGVIDDSKASTDWPDRLRAQALSMRALAHAARNDLETAQADLAAARALDAASVDVLKTGIQLDILSDDPQGARERLARALEQYPDHPGLLLLHAALVAQEDPALAMADYRRVIEQDPANYISAQGRVARLRLAQSQIVAQAYDQAADTLKPLSRGGLDPFVNYLNGVLAFQQGDYTRAGELLLKVLEIAPEHNPTRLMFGTVNYASRNYQQAAYFLSKYVAVVPDNMVARKLLARSYMLLGKNAEAGKVIAAAPRDDTEDAELLALAAISDMNKGEMAAGIAGLERAVRVSPDSAVLRTALARAYIDSGETGQAISELNSLLKRGDDQRQTEALLVLALLRAGELSQAINRVLDMVSRYPADAAIETLAGSVFAASGDLDEARRYLESVTAREPDFMPATMTLAGLEEQQENYSRATALYEKLVETNSPSVIPYLALARIGEKQGDLEGMREWLERAQQQVSTDFRPYQYLAEYYLRQGETALARGQVNAALELSPEMPELLALTGRIFMAEQDYRQALRPLQALVKAEPTSVTARILLGESYLRLGNIDEARSELQAALDHDSGNASVYALLTRLEIKAGDSQQALKYSRLVQQDTPDAAMGYELAGDSLMAAGQHDEAEREYSQAWQRQPSSRVLIKRSGNVIRGGSPDTAIAWLDEWIESNPKDARVGQFLGATLQQAGNKSRAIEVYRRVLEVEPDNAVALNNLAVLYLEQGRAEALELAERAWSLAKDNPGVQDTYGWALVQAGQYGRGLDLLKKALKALPEVPEVRYHHAVALYQAGDKARGLKALQELLAADSQFEGRTDAERLLLEWQEQANSIPWYFTPVPRLA